MKPDLGLILSFCVILIFPCNLAFAENIDTAPMTVTIPYMDVEGPHRRYADEVLAKALELSKSKYGPYRIEIQQQESVIRRQLVELQKGTSISVAVSMPTPEWLENALPVRFPLMKGISSYRLFLGHKDNQPLFTSINNLNDLKKVSIGQGPGWSTGKILEDNGFKVVYGGPYPTLLPMLDANRFQLLMRGIFEVEPELKASTKTMPNIVIVEYFAVYTYLPMYFFVAKNQPLLAERIEYGLKIAHANGQLNKIFNRHFGSELKLLKNKNLKIFYVQNTNIDRTFFQQDKPYLLDSIIKLEEKNSHVDLR
jgi:ABC-type amino acid transport substrate-binding protein